MEVLRSALMNNAEKIEEQPALGGLYGSDGFFFQQRRGHLNLRNIASIDMDKLVREVDVDLLQIHIENITFCNLREEDLRYLTDPQIVKLFRISQLMLEYLLYSQDKLVENLNNYAQKYAEKKRTLAKKRRELAELEESTKLLRNQVKAKKQNIATLEDLLREANRTREKELRKLKLAKGESPPERPSVVRFFIVGPEGLCVEFVQRTETQILQLVKEARKAFVSKRDNDVNYDQGMVELRLVFKGKLLLPEQTIEECEIREGDTLMAMLVEDKKAEQPAVAPAPVAAPAPVIVKTDNNEAFTRQMFEAMAKQNQEQLRDIVQDINAGWKTALETIAANTRPTVIEHNRDSGLDPQLLASMQDKWSRTELNLQEKLHELELKQAQSDQEIGTLSVLAARRRLRLGDLEDDEDAERRAPPAAAAPDNSAFIHRIERVEHTTTYTSLDVERMRAELDELKRRLAERPAPTPAPAPAPVVVVEAPKPKEFTVAHVKQEKVVTRSNKWDHLPSVKAGAAASAAPVKEQATTKAVVFEMEPVVAPKPQVVAAPKPEVKPKPLKPVPAAPTEVVLAFPAQFNRELSVLLFSEADFLVTVPSNISLDDLLFEVRTAASVKTRTKLKKVAVEYKGKRVLLGMDLGDDAAGLTAERASELTKTGELRLVILPGNPLTNAQIDMLVPSWEKDQASTSKSGTIGVSRDSADGGKTPRSHFRQRRKWEDEEEKPQKGKTGKSVTSDDVYPPEEGALPKAVYRKMRSSLDEALSEISDREGLTDSELQQQMERLKLTTETLPKDVSDHLKSFKGAMAGALAAAAAADSGSDTAGATNPRSADEVFRSSGGSLSGRDFSNVRASRSISLAGKDGAPAGLLRISHSGPHSPGEMSRSSVSVSSTGSHLRRSLEQFANEDDLSSTNMLDDVPMLASVNNSADFRRQAAPARAAPAPVAVGAVAMSRDIAGVGIAQQGGRGPTAASTGTATLQGDSLIYSPSVSVAASARSRYSAEENEEQSDLDDSFVRARPEPKPQAPEKPVKTRWTKAADRTEDEVSFNVTASSVGDWAGAAAAAGHPDTPPEDDDDLRADSKGRRGGDGNMVKVTDSVDSFKRELRAGAKGDMSVTDSHDRFRNTGDHTVMSSIPTLEDSVNTFSDQDRDFLRDRGTGGLGSTTTTNVEDVLSSTIDSEGEMLVARGGAGKASGVRASEVGRRADALEREAARGASKSNVEAFGHDDENSIHSLALSDSNNLDEM